jgi:hypothetical protein
MRGVGIKLGFDRRARKPVVTGGSKPCLSPVFMSLHARAALWVG